MAIYAGAYSESVWHGVLREAKYPVAVCTHKHPSRAEARKCADAAKVRWNTKHELSFEWRAWED